MAANLVTVFVEALAGRAGIVFRGGPELITPRGAPGLLMLLLTVAVLPAVTEEFLLRGVLLPALRPFGDGFAVVCTAVLFALLHQNMQQAPMAFAAGLALGRVYLRSGGRLTIPIIVHGWNNAAAVALGLVSGRAANVYALALGLLGMLSLAYLFLRRRPAPPKVKCELPAYRRAFSFFFGSAAMVLPLLYFIVVIVLNTQVG
jgi:membrane protease YdiL (CAAX protease family)